LVVYKINCKTCNVDYIGKTEKILVHRLNEHQKKKQTTNKSACYEYIEENPTHEMDYENIQVIDHANSNFKLRMKELLHILKEQPELNKQLNSQSDYEIKTLIIQAYPQHRKK
jgi:ribosomal protein L24